jgi:hypothetical protein
LQPSRIATSLGLANLSDLLARSRRS